LTKITVDVLNINSAPIDQHEDTSRNVMDEFMRFRHIRSSYEASDDIYEAARAYPQVNWRYYVPSSLRVSSIAHMNFNPEKTWKF